MKCFMIFGNELSCYDATVKNTRDKWENKSAKQTLVRPRTPISIYISH